MPTILYAEDTTSLREAYAKGLREAGLTVVEAQDGEEAWEAAQKQDFDLILSDFEMPRLSGLLLLQRLRKDARYREKPFFIMSARDEPLIHDASWRAGKTVWLMKPIGIRELVDALRRFCPTPD